MSIHALRRSLGSEAHYEYPDEHPDVDFPITYNDLTLVREVLDLPGGKQ